MAEPFREWVIGAPSSFAQPRWEEAGVVVTDDVRPYQERKLLLLNGGHSLLAYVGGLRGHSSVASACNDPVCLDWLYVWWGEAAACLRTSAADLKVYQDALLERFTNSRIVHRLDQIAADGSQKLPVRTLPVLRRHRASGRMPHAAVEVLAAWVCHLRGLGVPLNDPHAEGVDVNGTMTAAVPRALDLLDPEIIDDHELVLAVVRRAKTIEWAL